MASLARVLRLGITKNTTSLVRQNLRALPCHLYSSTTKKVSQSEFVIGKQTEIDPKRVEEIIAEGSREPKDDLADPGYVSHGFHDDPHWDTYAYRLVFFSTISIVMVFGPVFLHYVPDPTGREWAQKEAQVVLEERRAAGLPLIDPDFIDPSKLVLPEEDPEPIRTL